MKNPHGVEPTRYKKKKDRHSAIKCNTNCGPLFGVNSCFDICINDTCNRRANCYISNNGYSYECHPQYKSSLFVNTAGSNEKNKFKVSDYEVYSIDY